MKFTEKPCTICGQDFKPTSSRQSRCEACLKGTAITTDEPVEKRKRYCSTCGGRFESADQGTRCELCISSNPIVGYQVEVPTVAKLPGRVNRTQAAFALKMAEKALNEKGLAGYAANLITYARQASVGAVPNQSWQIENLGHLIRS